MIARRSNLLGTALVTALGLAVLFGLPALRPQALFGTVAEPLNLQGWQLVDELNRAIQGAPCSGYVTSPAVVDMEGAKAMGDSVAFDPANGYREAYSAIWGK